MSWGVVLPLNDVDGIMMLGRKERDGRRGRGQSRPRLGANLRDKETISPQRLGNNLVQD